MTLEHLLRAAPEIASDGGATPKIPPDRPEEAVLQFSRELAKRLAREDHDAEIAARQASYPAISESP
jgi:hypothetical protein